MNTANDEWSNSMDQFTFKSFCIATDVRYESKNMIIIYWTESKERNKDERLAWVSSKFTD